jgi:hypothetical protein
MDGDAVHIVGKQQITAEAAPGLAEAFATDAIL